MAWSSSSRLYHAYRQGRARSASAVVPGTSSGFHLFEVESYSTAAMALRNGDRLRSRPFRVGGHEWHVEVYPNGRLPDTADSVSVFLVHDGRGGDRHSAGAAHAWYTLSLFVVRGARGGAAADPSEMRKEYGTWIPPSAGKERFIRKDKLQASVHDGDGDSVTVRCDVTVLEALRLEERYVAAMPITAPPPSPDVGRRFADLLPSAANADQDRPDVTFEVDGESFAAHKRVLVEQSPVFRAELLDPMKESASTPDTPIHIDDMKADAFKAMLHFIYTDTLPTEDQDDEEEEEEEAIMCQHLLVAADRYGLARLKLTCELKLCKYITTSTVAIILTLAEQHRCDALKGACLEFVNSIDRLKAVAATDGFEHLVRSCPSMIKDVVANVQC